MQQIIFAQPVFTLLSACPLALQEFCSGSEKESMHYRSTKQTAAHVLEKGITLRIFVMHFLYDETESFFTPWLNYFNLNFNSGHTRIISIVLLLSRFKKLFYFFFFIYLDCHFSMK